MFLLYTPLGGTGELSGALLWKFQRIGMIIPVVILLYLFVDPNVRAAFRI